jgi:hypothetical protein
MERDTVVATGVTAWGRQPKDRERAVTLECHSKYLQRESIELVQQRTLWRPVIRKITVWFACREYSRYSIKISYL